MKGLTINQSGPLRYPNVLPLVPHWGTAISSNDASRHVGYNWMCIPRIETGLQAMYNW